MVSGNSGLAGRGARACESTATQEGNNATNQKEGGFLCSTQVALATPGQGTR